MLGLDKHDTLFVIWAFVLQICLIALFAIRKTNLDLILQHGWVFYLLSIPAVIVSITLICNGKEWSFWIGGFIFLLWAIFGFVVEYGFGISVAQPDCLVCLCAVCCALFGNNYVLLVSCRHSQPTAMVHLCPALCIGYLLEYLIALNLDDFGYK